MNSYFTWRGWPAGLGAAIGLAASIVTAAPTLAALPPSSAHYGVIKSQHIRFNNAPLFKKANAAANRHDDAAAIKYFQAILKNDPGSNPAKLALIALYERTNRYDDGQRLCTELIRQYPDFIDAYLAKGYLAMKSGQYDLAAAAWQEGLHRAPAGFSRRLELLKASGQAYALLGRYSAAASAYAQALSQAFDVATALEYFYILKAMPEPEKGQAMLERILAASPPPSIKREALYELAQLQRRSGQMPDYFQCMETLVREDADAHRLYDYSLQLYDAGHLDLALTAAHKGFDLEKNPRQKLELGLFIAELFIEQRRPANARAWLEKIAPCAESDIRWPLTMARTDFLAGDYRPCCDRLMALKERPANASLLLGLAFMKRGMPGPALDCLNEMRRPDQLTPDEQLSLFRNRAYLNFDQHQHAQAIADTDAAMELEPSADMALVRLKSLASISNDIEKAGEYLLNPTKSGLRLTGAEQAQVLTVMGRCLSREKQYAQAIQQFTDAAQLDPCLAEAFYLRGLAYHALDKPKEALTNYQAYVRMVTNPPATFWGDLGQAEGKHHEYKKGTTALDRSLEYHSVDVDTLSDQGYQFMKWAFPHQDTNCFILGRWSHNREAKQSFRRALDLYADLVPRVPTNETATYRDHAVAMKQEYTKLDHLFGIQAYLSRTDYGFPTNVGISSIAGALPSQGGLELSLRPPVIGFLNERTMDVFGNVSGNFKRQTWAPDSDSYQGMAGLRIKPFIRLNYNMSFARLFKIGANAEDNWLWRNMASWEHDEKPAPGKTVGLNLKLFGDVGYYFEQRTRWYGYFDGRAGPSWRLHQNVLLTLPQAMGILRYESNDEGDTGSYGLAGIGATLRLFEQERRYTINRLYVDIFAYYTWGEFMSAPSGFDGRAFDGLMIGASLVK